MNSQPIGRGRLAIRLVVNMIIGPAILFAVLVGVIWLLGMIGIINING
ncbi:hypothetical protein [Bradyrhizobium cosmicum]|nr:hypothetical protein [Bradyrhizobium cosmicum]